MREILFRGKDSSGNWHYGYYVGRDTIVEWGDMVHDCGYINDSVAYECDGETIGQFTGVLDKKGNKVFDGDIFENSAGCRYLVFFEDGCFMAKLICDMPDAYVTKLKLCEISHLISDECEVIGNRWDNPELLKGG